VVARDGCRRGLLDGMSPQAARGILPAIRGGIPQGPGRKGDGCGIIGASPRTAQQVMGKPLARRSVTSGKSGSRADRYAPAEISASGCQRANDLRDIPDRPLAGSLSPDARRTRPRIRGRAPEGSEVRMGSVEPMGWQSQSRDRVPASLASIIHNKSMINTLPRCWIADIL